MNSNLLMKQYLVNDLNIDKKSIKFISKHKNLNNTKWYNTIRNVMRHNNGLERYPLINKDFLYYSNEINKMQIKPVKITGFNKKDLLDVLDIDDNWIQQLECYNNSIKISFKNNWIYCEGFVYNPYYIKSGIYGINYKEETKTPCVQHAWIKIPLDEPNSYWYVDLTYNKFDDLFLHYNYYSYLESYITECEIENDSLGGLVKFFESKIV